MDDALHILTGGTPPRVRSMLATIFGDLALAPGARLSGATLSALTAPMGIRSEALRTATHRLRRDGWIETARAGRGMTHGLTARGRAESAAAGPRIYAARAPEALFLFAVPPGAELPDAAHPVAPGLGLCARPLTDAIPLRAASPPDWMRARVGPPELVDAMAEMVARMRAAGPLLPDAPSPVEAATLRVALVHGWRRIALRAPDLPDRAFPEGWRGAEGRALLHDLLARLPRPEGLG